MNYISLNNLTRYHRNFRDYGDARYALTRGSLWKQTEKAGAVTCWPVGESRMKPVVEFLFKETLPVGDKSSQNPSTIEGVNNILVRRLGKNILFTNKTYPSSSVYNNVTFTYNADKSITINGTASATTQVWLSLGADKLHLFTENTYRLSGFTSSSQTGIRLIIAKGNEYRVINPTTTSASFSPLQSSVYGCFIEINNEAVINNVTIYPQLELGSTATEYEPFVLNSYTIPLGSTFYGGILDVSTGKLTVTHRMIEADSLTLDISNYPAYLPLECTDTFGRTITSTGNILALTGSTGGKIVYKLANPYTVQIDPVAITSLPQIDKYTPRLNTLYTDAENITVKYIKSPIRDEYEKVQAIIANGGTI